MARKGWFIKARRYHGKWWLVYRGNHFRDNLLSPLTFYSLKRAEAVRDALVATMDSEQFESLGLMKK